MKKRIFSKVFMAIAMILAVVCVSFSLTSCGRKKHLIQSEKPTPSPDDPAPVNPDWYVYDVSQVVDSHDDNSTTSSSIKAEKPIEPIIIYVDEIVDIDADEIVDIDADEIVDIDAGEIVDMKLTVTADTDGNPMISLVIVCKNKTFICNDVYSFKSVANSGVGSDRVPANLTKADSEWAYYEPGGLKLREDLYGPHLERLYWPPLDILTTGCVDPLREELYGPLQEELVQACIESVRWGRLWAHLEDFYGSRLEDPYRSPLDTLRRYRRDVLYRSLTEDHHRTLLEDLRQTYIEAFHRSVQEDLHRYLLNLK